MFKGSFWYPTNVTRAALLLAVLLAIPLHQSELLGLMSSSTLVFGWLPIQMAYDVAFLLGGVVVLYAMYSVAPDPPAEMEPTKTGAESGPVSEPVATDPADGSPETETGRVGDQ